MSKINLCSSFKNVEILIFVTNSSLCFTCLHYYATPNKLAEMKICLLSPYNTVAPVLCHTKHFYLKHSIFFKAPDHERLIF